MATLAQWKKQIKAQNSSLTKMVNGNSIALTTAEYDKTIDEWAKASFDQEVEKALIAFDHDFEICLIRMCAP